MCPRESVAKKLSKNESTTFCNLNPSFSFIEGKNSFNLGQCEMPLRNDHINNGFFENTTL